MTKLLFVCTMNTYRSPTAEDLFRSDENETRSAGTDTSCPNPLTAEHVEWADMVVFMEEGHRKVALNRKALKKALHGKKQLVLGVPDRYDRNQPELLELLKEKLPRFA